MKKTAYAVAVLALFVSSAFCVRAVSSSQAWKDWAEARGRRMQAEATYGAATLQDRQNKTPENDRIVVTAAKSLLNAWLDEAQTWLTWRDLEAQQNPDVPASIRKSIDGDVNRSMGKISELRDQVAAFKTVPEGIDVWVKLVGNYLNLTVDVARNSGAMWVAVGDKMLDTADNYEVRLRAAALRAGNSSSSRGKLDNAKSELAAARNEMRQADESYRQVVIPGEPVVMFNQGNSYLMQAKEHLINAQSQMAAAFNLIYPKQ